MGGSLCQDDEPCACAPYGETVTDDLLERLLEVEVLRQPAERRGFPSRYHKSVQTTQFACRSYLPHVSAQAAEDGLVFYEVALESENSDGCHFNTILARHGMIHDPIT